MRTTVTLEPDVERMLRESMRKGRQTFKEALNEAVRRGLRGELGEEEPDFVVKARPMGMRPGIDPAKVRDLGDEMEVDDFLEKTRKLESSGP